MTERTDRLTPSPGGAEYTRMAARLAGVTAASRCLNLSVGHNLAGITVARTAGCQVLAISQDADRMRVASDIASQAGVGHLIRFEIRDPHRLTFPIETFDLVVAEGGALRSLFGSADWGISRVYPYLKHGGTLAASDMVYTLSPPPDTVRDRLPNLWTERRYTLALETQGFMVEFMCYVARRGWRTFIAGSGRDRAFWESRDARAGLACLYMVAGKKIHP